MSITRVIFVSAVSNEFHRAAADAPHLFQSYRDVLKHAFRTLTPNYEVIVQEDLVVGVGDLLETLDGEIARSLIVVHLVGALAGSAPELACLRNLRARHPDLLAVAPELRQLITDDSVITYTQWEIYLAFHHQKRHLIFEAGKNAPRSPFGKPGTYDQSSQIKHLSRLAATGAHRGVFEDQGDVARKTIRSFLHSRIDPDVDPVEPSDEAVGSAWGAQERIVKELEAAIRKPDPRAVPVTDPANVAAFVAAVRACAERWHVNLTTIVSIAAHHCEAVRAVAEARPTPETLYEQAFAEFAIGDLTAARHTARRAANLALELRHRQPEGDVDYRESAFDSLFLLHSAAEASRDIPAAIAALEEAGALIDKNTAPLRWVEVHEPLARFLIEHAHYSRAEELISDAIDIREEFQGDEHPDLGLTLLLWARLLDAQADYAGMESVAARSERIFAAQTPPELLGIAVAISDRANALFKNYQSAEAEPLMRRALAIEENYFGSDHPRTAIILNNLAQLLGATNRRNEAEPLLDRALAINENCFGSEHPIVATALNNLATLLYVTDRISNAEPLMQRALDIDEKYFGVEHPNVARDLNNLAQLHYSKKRLDDAEPLMRRASAINEKCFGPEHPKVATDLISMVRLFQDTERANEAEPLVRRALAIDENDFGPEHPNVARDLNALASVFRNTGRQSEAEKLMRRALAIYEKSPLAELSETALTLSNLAVLLRDTGLLTEAESLMIRCIEMLLRLTEPTGRLDPHLRVAVADYISIIYKIGNNLSQYREYLKSLFANYGVSPDELFHPEG